MNQYHTIELELNHPFDLQKDCWDSIYLDRLQEACNPGAKADIAAIVMQEGLAHVCLVTQSMTITKSRIERNIPKKNQVCMNIFLTTCYNHI
jgi:protein pelota